MGGFSIGFGVGLRYPAPNKKIEGSTPPDPDITDALLMEDGSLFLMEDGSYFMLEKSVEVKTKAKMTTKVDKSYWNF